MCGIAVQLGIENEPNLRLRFVSLVVKCEKFSKTFAPHNSIYLSLTVEAQDLDYFK